MNKLLITLSAIAVSMLAFTATSDAGHKVKYLAGYDSCGRPVYAYKYVQSYSHSRSYCAPSYRSYGRSYSYRPSYRSYNYRPSYSYRPSYRSYSRSYRYRPSYRSYSRGGYCR